MKISRMVEGRHGARYTENYWTSLLRNPGAKYSSRNAGGGNQALRVAATASKGMGI